ncbi:MAG: hypothetical protein AAGN35_13560 [Bacteroidota bacterium]
MKRIQLIYLIVSALLVMAFTTAGYRGYRFMSYFVVSTWVHTGAPGVHHK